MKEYIYHVICNCKNKTITFGIGSEKINIESLKCNNCGLFYKLEDMEIKDA